MYYSTLWIPRLIFKKYFPSLLIRFRGVVPGGARGAVARPYFCRSVNPISTKGEQIIPTK